MHRLWTVVVALEAAATVAASAQDAALTGRVLDAVSQEPVGGAVVRCDADQRATRTDAAGRFRLVVPGGSCDVRIVRIGYRPLATRIVAGRDASLRLAPAAIDLDAVTVAGARDDAAAYRASTVLDGAALDRRLATSIAATIAGEPGVTQRFNGPMAAQPVVRGLTGDRVPVLEDGQRTGDIATTAPDHAVTIDPVAARRIEVVRGPAALLFGSNPLGGVVNVTREDVPRAVPAGLTGSVLTGGESVNVGGSFGGELIGGRGPLAVRLAGNARTGNDTRTPGGMMLPFTDHDGYELGAGASLAGARGHIGGAVRDFRTFYGVPSSFGGVTLPGAHAGGVYIDLRRTVGRLEGEFRPARGALQAVSIAAQYVRFEQDEFEQGGFVGTRFGQLAASGDIVARIAHGGSVPGRGAVGVWHQWRDFRAVGSFTGTRPATLQATALYGYDELELGAWRLAIGGRADGHRLTPLDSTETRLLRGVRTRAFTAWSGAATLTRALVGNWRVGGGVARAFRAPAIEELFSAGPHLATYAYEVGNPDLGAERGAGAELFVEHDGPRARTTLTAFRNAIAGFIRYAPLVDPATGLPQLDTRLRRYPVYQASQTDAVLEGIEGRTQFELVRRVAVDATVSWIRGTERSGAQPLPAMPPLRARLEVRRDSPAWFAGATVEAIGAQRRVPRPVALQGSCNVNVAAEGIAALLPAEFCPTDGATLLHLTAGRRFSVGGRLHALTLSLDNALDARWRDHLWRAKQVAPQPGRNVRLLYRVFL
jgi:iron complex outermembrane receptor protein